MKSTIVLKRLLLAAAMLAPALPLAIGQEKTVSLPITPTAIKGSSNFVTHPLGLNGTNRSAQWMRGKSASASSQAKSHPGPPPRGFYPADISNPSNGPTVTSAAMHGLYINGAPSTWGNPASFLNDLSQSTMIQIADDYVGSNAKNRYKVGNGAVLSGALPHIIYDDTIVQIAYIGASIYGSGYGHIYHIFLPPGQDVCFTGTTECYSPDNLNTFAFCAYHASVDFPDIGHVLLTVEPFQNVDGCAVQAPSPNGLLIDSTADVLSHETFETITDPDGTAWWNQYSLDLFGAEIADECQNFNFGYNNVTLNGKSYEIQPEYSNNLHACTYVPHGVGLP